MWTAPGRTVMPNILHRWREFSKRIHVFFLSPGSSFVIAEERDTKSDLDGIGELFSEKYRVGLTASFLLVWRRLRSVNWGNYLRLCAILSCYCSIFDRAHFFTTYTLTSLRIMLVGFVYYRFCFQLHDNVQSRYFFSTTLFASRLIQGNFL